MGNRGELLAVGALVLVVLLGIVVVLLVRDRTRVVRAERRSRLAAEQARRQLDVVTQVTAPLAPALELPEEAIAAIAGLVVPQLADVFAVDLVRPDDELDRVVAAYADAETERTFEAHRASSAAWADRPARVMERGSSELVYTTPDGTTSSTPAPGHDGLMLAMGMQSWVVAPLQVRGRPLGTITLAVRPARRGYRPSDRATIDDLAARCSIAFERARLYQEVRDAAEAARVGEERLRALIEGSPLGILEVDDSGAVVFANSAARAMFPPDGGGPEGSPALPGPLRDLLAEHAATPSAEGAREIEITIPGSDPAHATRVLGVSAARLPGADGPLVLAMVSDATARKRLEEQLTRAQRYEAIASLAGGVAHDFNNLLTVILGYSGMLLQAHDDDSPDREPLEAIQEAGNHAAVITNQLLSLSRHQALHPETIDPAARCAALLPMFRRLTGDRIVVEVRRTGRGWVRVDPGQLEQVLFNLVGNSRDAMSAGGRVLIEAGEVEAGTTGEVVLVRVTDDGEGMDADTLARSQEPFFTTKGHSRGTGLGLATVASVLERAGGTLELTSEPGTGTIALARFPRAEEQPVRGDEAADRTSARVLLVDDEDQVRHFGAEVLGRAGYEVVAVADAESALDELTAGRFDLLVSDVVLPGKSGIELVHTVRERSPELACVLVSGFTRSEPPEGVVLVAKPFAPEDLLRAASTALLSSSSTR